MATHLRPIERLRNPSKQQFETAVRLDQPVIIEDVVQGWRAFNHWTPQYLAQQLGGLSVRVRTSATHIHPDLESARLERNRPLVVRTARRVKKMLAAGGDERAQMRFDELLALLAKPDGFHYMAGSDELTIRNSGRWNEALAAIRGDYELPSYLEESRYETAGLWVSGRGVRSHLHYDGNFMHNLNAQVTGSKHVQLYSPEQISKIYPYLYTSGQPHNFSQVDVDNIDERRFPLFAELEGYEATLAAGDLLFIPAYWYHTFKHLGDFNTNVNFWWRADFVRLTPVSARDYLGLQALELVSRSRIPPFWVFKWFGKFDRHLTQSR